MRSTSTALMAAALLGAISVATVAVRAQGGPGGAMPPTAVETTRPRVEAITETVSAVGTLRAAESVVLRPELAGRIEKVQFEEGQRIAKGAPLFSLDASLARADVNEWQATVDQSRREMSRAADLVARKLAAQNDLDSKRSQVEVNEARLSSARARLDKTVIRAPFDGIVGLRKVSPGEYVNIGDELVTLTQIDPIKLDFRVPEVYLGRAAADQVVSVTVDAFPGQTFAGHVYAIDPQLDTQGRAVVLRALLENDEGRLRPGLFARVTLEFGRRENALLVPESALWPQGAKQFVYTVVGGKAALVPVTIGARRAGMVEIVSGIAADTEVITAGQLKIGPDAPVQAINAPAAAPKPAQ